jgi:hypothetical protein
LSQLAIEKQGGKKNKHRAKQTHKIGNEPNIVIENKHIQRRLALDKIVHFLTDINKDSNEGKQQHRIKEGLQILFNDVFV